MTTLSPAMERGASVDRRAPPLATLRSRLRPAWGRVVSLLDRAAAQITVDNERLDRWAQALDPMISTRVIRARVVAIIDEARDTKSFVLRPNARFSRAFRPGSFVVLRLDVDGRPVTRSYSISSADIAAGLVTITVKRVEGGLASNWLCRRLRVGDVVEMGEAQGQFVLPKKLPESVLFLSAGSGITPVMAMLRHLTASPSTRRLAFLHWARSPDDLIFRAELESLAARHANLHVGLSVEDAGEGWTGASGRFTRAQLAAAVPDWKERPIFLCGPPLFMRAVIEALEADGFDLSRLFYERFGPDIDVSKFLHGASLVRFRRSGTEAVASTPTTILDVAEARGLSPVSGCRAGVCGTCRCKKLRGVVLDVSTGRESGPGEEMIHPCVSLPKGSVDVDL
jgi:ferredoxin-NADP reductase